MDFKLNVPYTTFDLVFQNLVGLLFSCVKQDLLNLFHNKLLKFKQIDIEIYSIRVLKFNYFFNKQKILHTLRKLFLNIKATFVALMTQYKK